MEIKTILSIIATGIALISCVPYIRDIWLGKTKPHAFSWFIWAILGFIAGAGQIAGGGGIGAIIVMTTSFVNLGISLYAFKKATQDITQSDWVSLLIALAAIPLWVITKGPLLSVILVSFIDAVGFWPTIRKSFNSPQDETVSTWVLSTIKHCLTVVAQEKYNLVTTIYPGSLAVLTAVFVIGIELRKVQLAKRKKT